MIENLKILFLLISSILFFYKTERFYNMSRHTQNEFKKKTSLKIKPPRAARENIILYYDIIIIVLLYNILIVFYSNTFKTFSIYLLIL